MVRKKRHRPKSTADVRGCAERMIRAVGKNVSEADPVDLGDLARLEDALAQAYRIAVDGLRAARFTDGDIAEALGVSRITVLNRWPASGPRPTGGAAVQR